MFYFVEVIETKKAYKPNQKDDDGNILFDGSIQVKTVGDVSIAGHIKNLWCAPATFNRRIPLIGEHVLIFEATSTEKSASDLKTKRYYYFTTYNTVDDVSSHNLPRLYQREKTTGPYGSKQPADILADKKELGYTVSKKIKGTQMLQPFEGDDIWQGRFGQSIRYTHTYRSVNTPGVQIYQNDANKYWPGKSQFDPITIMRVKFPKAGDGFDIEDLSKDQASLYLTTSQKLLKFTAGFAKNCLVKKIPNWQGAQALMDADRIVLNAKKDNAFLVANKTAVVTGRKVVFQSNKHSVDLDDLMSWLKQFSEQFRQLCTGEQALTTAMGPTGPSAHSAQVVKTAKVEYKLKFKKTGCGSSPAFRFGVGLPPGIPSIIAPVINAALSGPNSGPAGSAIVAAAASGAGGAGGSSGGGGGGGGASGGGSGGSGGGGGGGSSSGANAGANSAGPGEKVDVNDAGIPTRNNRDLQAPIDANFASKLSGFAKDTGTVVTDTNDTAIHKSQLQKTGRSVDMGYADFNSNPKRIEQTIAAAEQNGLKAVWEVRTPEERDKIVSANPNLKGKVVAVGYITAPHFSIYDA